MAGAARRSENEFKFSKGPAIETYVGDITEAKADVLVVPEGVSFGRLGYIGRQMMELSPKFRKNREKLKEEKPLAAWDVYTSKLGGKRFKHVIHAIVVPCPERNVKEWSNKMHLLYQRIFQEADRKIATVLAVPLLGTGRGGGRLEDTIEAAVISVANFKQTNLKRVLFVSNEEYIVCQIASRCEWQRGHGGSRQKWRPLASGSDVTYNNAKVKSPVHDESAKRNRKGSRLNSARERLEPTNVISGKQAPFHPPSTKSQSSKDTKLIRGDTKQRNVKGVKKDRQQEQESEMSLKAKQTNHQKNTYSPEKGHSSYNKRVLNNFVSKRDMNPSQNETDQSESESLQFQQQQEQQQKIKELQRVNDIFRNTGDGSNRMLQHYSNEDHGSSKRWDKSQEHYCSDDTDDNSFDEDYDEFERTRKSHQDTHMPRPRGNYQNDLHQMSPHELLESKLFFAEELELNENGLPGRKNRDKRQDHYFFDEAEENSSEEDNDENERTSNQDRHMTRGDYQCASHQMSPRELFESQLSPAEARDLNLYGLPGLKNHGARPKENKEGPKVIHEESAYQPGENNVNDLYQISQRHQSKANVVEPKSRSALQEKDHFKSVGPSKLLETQGDKEQHEYDKPDQKSHGARPKEKKKNNTMDAKNSEDSQGKDICPICICEITDPKRLHKCGHVFCHDCIDNSFKQFKPVCPSCNMVYGEIRGNQPDGQMDVGFSGEYLPGYEGHGTITITYYFPSGTQGVGHPSPGQPYKGTTRRAYLPDNKEGKDVLKLLRKAFDRKLTFTIGRSTTTGQENVVTWNDIHHKTNKDGGPTRFGYPDKTYLQRVREELASKGVTSDSKQ